MTITNKTIKHLYAKSGNICAFPNCNKILIEDTNYSNICHIISKKNNGPRHKDGYGDYDDESNLILLCCNHHNEIDENEEYYTIEILRDMKKNHEKKMKQLIKNDENSHKLKKILLKNIDKFDIVKIIENTDFESAFNTYKLEYMNNFKDVLEDKILNTYNFNYVDSEFMYDMRKLYEYFYQLTLYLYENTQSKNGSVSNGVPKAGEENSYIYKLRLKIANVLRKYI